ncbi:MAG: GGDEF domain-containing protein, partial [Lachnospiraceae bacterium]|nr:GGDEF domain-containing protein [Lachnospiraceae bacterium]
MSYSTVGILALIVLLIVNHQELFVPIDRSRKKDEVSRVNRRYRYFLIACICYFVTDIAWGFLYEHHDIPLLFPIIYSYTIFYFIFMFLTMLTWIRYVVAYLDKSGLKSKALLYYVWSMFTLAILYLMVNRFHPFIFYFNDAHEYVPESGRYIAFLIQILLYAVTSTYLLYISARSKGQER